MRILKLRNYKIFLKDVSEEGDPDFTAYFYGQKQTDAETLANIECWLRELILREAREQEEDTRDFYAELNA